MKEIDITYGEYAAKWGLTDLYPESEDKLRQALLSGEDFDTGWWGCKKEIRYCRITQEIGMITVEVSAHMDDLWESEDLIYDALWETTRKEYELPEEIIGSIRDDAIDDGVDDHWEEYADLQAPASYESVLSTIGKLEDLAETRLHEMYETLCQIVKAHVDYMNQKED